LFSFNSPYGACPICKGLGVQDRIDPQLLIADPQKTLRQGALKITNPSGYIIYSQVTIEVLNRVCRAHGFSVDIPWKDLNETQRKIVLYGSDKIKIPFGKHPLESRLRWTGITAKPREEGYYKGIIPIMENILRVKRNANILRFARTMPCEACKGTRLRPEALAVTFRELDIGQMVRQSIDRLYDFFAGLHFSTSESPVAEPLREIFLKRSLLLKKLGLGYLTLDRESTTLSTGEVRRLCLAAQVGGGLRGVMYVLDEPSVGLHPRDNQRLLEILRQLRDNGNTVIVVEHDEETIRSADWLIDIGPDAGVHGGEILFSGPPGKLLEADAPDTYPLVKNSKTRAFMTGKETIEIPLRRRTGTGKILKITGAQEHNLKNIDVPFKLGVLNVVSGVSGAGKSTLVHDILANTLKKYLHNASTRPGKHKKIEGSEFIDKVIEIDQSPIGRTPRSNPATYTKLFDHIRDLFALLPESKARKWSKGRFSFNVKGGRCETCEGAGVRQIGMHFLGNVDAVCEECGGKRFNDKTLEIRFKKKNIYDILEMPIEEAAVFFYDQPQMKRYFRALLELGLGYIALGQPATTLSGGEAQRIKLAAELCRPSTGNTLYILDEPTTGLHTSDIKTLLESLNRLIEKGNTVITVEHHPDFIKSADWVIDLGPESGDKGGELVAIGTPEQILPSATRGGRFLKKLPPPGPPLQKFFIKGASTHNLKNIDVEIPVNRLTVITGVSGSGKSSLAFDTIFAQGQKRFLAGFSTYARRLLTDRSTGTDVEECTGLTPPIAVNQKTIGRNPRSTVGTMTEIYDFYRLLFSRLGKPHCPTCNKPLKDGCCPGCDFQGQKTLSAKMFSFNHHLGACIECKGLGITRTCDPGKLVTHPDHSLLNGAMEGSKTGRFYGDPFGQYTAILQAVGEAESIDFTLSWEELSHKARQIAMYGTGERKYKVAWKFKRKNREGVHRFEAVWKGFVNYINREYERKHADKRGQAMLHLLTDKTCPQCNGQRLKPEFLSVYFAGLNIAQMCKMTIKNSIEFFHMKSFCGGGLNQSVSAPVNQWASGSASQKVRGVGGEKLSSSKRRLEASKPFLHENSNALYDYRHFDTFSADSVQLKKPPGGPKGLIGPPCHGAPWPPEVRMKRIISNMLFLFCLTGFHMAVQVVPLPGLINPDSITVDNHYIYITDGEIIYIFSMDDFKLKTKFGKEGEGPKEFKINPAGIAKLQIDIQPDTIIVNSNSRVSFFTKDGKYLKEVQINSGNNFKQIGNHYVGYSTSREGKIIFLTINLYDSTFNKSKEIFRKEYYVQGNKKFNLVKLGCGNARRAVYTVYNEKIFVEGDENVIHVFNKKGDEEYVIKLDYDRLKVTEKHKKEILEDLYAIYIGPTMQELIKEKGYFPEYFTARIFKIADNKIFIPTYKKQNGKNEFIVLDLKGNVQKKIYLPFKDRTLLLAYPYAIRGNKLYQLFDNDETGGWELHITGFPGEPGNKKQKQ
jgi:excinuclease ABC A subunit